MMTTDASAINSGYSVESEHPNTADIQSFGFWLYLMSDLILFAALFATYVVLSHSYAGGATGKELFDLPRIFLETMILLISSATYGLAMLATNDDTKNLVLIWLGITFLLGLGFVVLEINEFHTMILAGNGPDRSAFLSSFFALVGTHGAHVTFGLIWIAVMMSQVFIKNLTETVKARLMRLGMFWHFLDVVWICLFTIVYLMGAIQ